MLISTAPLGNHHQFTPKEISSLDELAEVALNNNYSLATYKQNHRNEKNFIQAAGIGVDIDGGMTLDEAKTLFKDFKHLIMPSKSHQKEKNGIVCDRFRVILFFEDTITNPKDFRATWFELAKFCPQLDEACKDPCRYYYPSIDVISKNAEGKLWPITQYVEPERDPLTQALDGPVKEKGRLAKATVELLTYGARGGERHNALVKAVPDMKEQGYSVDEIIAKIDAMARLGGNWDTPYANDKDIETIQDVFDRHVPEEGLGYRENATTRKSMFDFKGIDELIKEAGEIEWLAEGLLTKGGFGMIVGPPKAGKSTLVRQLIKAVAQGSAFLERPVKQGKVLYLTFEEQPAILKKQFAAVGISPNDPILIHAGVVFGNTMLEDLKDAITEHEPQLVVLDTLFKISQLDSINNYKEVQDALANITKLARDTNTHILGVHHTNKSGTGNGSVMGSNAIHGAVDTLIRFVPEDEGRRYLWSNGKHGNHWEDQEIVFDKDKETYTLGKTKEQGVGTL